MTPTGSEPRTVPLAVRPATDADWAAIREVGWRSWEAAYGPFIPEADRRAFFDDFYTAERHRRQLANPRVLSLVAERDGRVVAFLVAAHQFAGVQLWRFYADPAAQRSGAGQALWNALLAWARGRGARRILFDVAKEGVSGPAFYRKQGCRVIGEAVEAIGRTPVRVEQYEYEVVPRRERSR